MRKAVLITFQILTLSSAVTFANDNPVIPINDNFYSLDLRSEILVYKDDSKDISIDELQTKLSEFEVRNSLNFGLYEGAIWIKGRLKSESTKSYDLILSINNPLLANVQLYVNGKSAGQAGQKIAYGNRSIPHRLVAFPIELSPQKSVDFALRLETSAPFNLPITIQRKEVFFNREKSIDLGFAIFLGIIMAMIVYNLFLYFSLLDITYLYYVGFIFSLHFLDILGNFGYLQTYLWPDSTWFAERQIAISIPIFNCFGLLFFASFLKIKHKLPSIYKTIQVIIWTSVALIPIPLFYFSSVVTAITNLLIAASIILCLSVLGYLLTKWDRLSQYFLLSWVPVFLSGLIFIFMTLGWLETNLVAQLSLVLSVGAESLTLSLALGFRINLIKSEKIKAEKEAALLQGQMTAAGEVQKAFFPGPMNNSNIEIKSEYVSADKTGGDIFGYHLDKIKNHIYLYVGDVTGHGIPAALMTGIVAGSVRTAIESMNTSSALPLKDQLLRVTRLIEIGFRDYALRSEKYVTFAIVVIDLNSGEAAYVNAAHPGIYRISKEKTEYLLESGDPLGRSSTINLGSMSFRLDEGDYLFLFTDGLIENTGPDGKSMTDRRLLNGLSYAENIQDIVSGLKHQMDIVWSHQKGKDDYAYLLLKFKAIDSKSKSA